MLRRIEVKVNAERWDGAARGHGGIAEYMSNKRYKRLVVARHDMPNEYKSQKDGRHFFTEEGWKYVGKAIAKYARKSGIEYRVIELEEVPDQPTVYRDELQVVLLEADIIKPKFLIFRGISLNLEISTPVDIILSRIVNLQKLKGYKPCRKILLDNIGMM